MAERFGVPVNPYRRSYVKFEADNFRTDSDNKDFRDFKKKYGWENVTRITVFYYEQRVTKERKFETVYAGKSYYSESKTLPGRYLVKGGFREPYSDFCEKQEFLESGSTQMWRSPDYINVSVKSNAYAASEYLFSTGFLPDIYLSEKDIQTVKNRSFYFVINPNNDNGKGLYKNIYSTYLIDFDA